MPLYDVSLFGLGQIQAERTAGIHDIVGIEVFLECAQDGFDRGPT